MLTRSLSIWLILFTLAACSRDKQHNIHSDNYWDSKTYFQNEIIRLNKNHGSLQKTLLFDTKTDSTNITQPSWDEELQSFLAIDLAKPHYRGRLGIDTLLSGDSFITVKYSALDSTLELRSCIITCQQRSSLIKDIEVTFDTHNSLYQYAKTFRYTPNSSYEIKGTQRVKLGREITYSIRGVFVKMAL